MSGLQFAARFVKKGERAFEQVSWIQRRSQIFDPDGQLVFEMDKVEAPESWSQLAIDVAASKYFRKTGLPQSISKTGSETSVKQMVSRVVNTITQAGELAKDYFSSKEDQRQFSEELTHILVQQKGAFNSPVWFNCGLFHQYGIKGSPGNFYWDDKEEGVKASTNAYEHPQCSACFIQSVEDDLSSIFDLIKQEAKIFKYGSGSGTNFSPIRGRQEAIQGGGKSSGVMAFLEVFDRGAGATKSGGVTRRAAKMVCLDMDHPEILEFIDWKKKEEEKARALIAAGYSAGFEGEAYKTVSGQNSNNSIRVTDAFINAVIKGEAWSTQARTTGEVIDTFQARDLWKRVADAAWACADPGIQFHDVINRWHTCPQSGSIRTSNPCSEYMFLDDSACNLASINLVHFLGKNNEFDLDGFLHTVRVLFVAQEIMVDLASYPTPKMVANSHHFRPLGLGYANLGAFLMRQGVAYDSEEGRAWTGVISALLTGQAYRVSAEMAQWKGAFAGFKKNQTDMLRVMRQHKKALSRLGKKGVPASLLNEAKKVWSEAIQKGEQFGYRNAQATVIAPTGTIGLLMDCDTTGIEPEYALVKYKKMAGGGYVKIINQSVPHALNQLGYNGAEIKEILHYIIENSTIEGAPHMKSKDLNVFDCATPSGKGLRSISAQAHIEIMAAAQPFLSGAISKTVNLPASSSSDEVEKIYMQAWQKGLKAVAIYRDGSKAAQPLSGKKAKSSSSSMLSAAPKPPAKALSEGHEAPECTICGYLTVRSGTCFKCLNCGQTTSC